MVRLLMRQKVVIHVGARRPGDGLHPASARGSRCWACPVFQGQRARAAAQPACLHGRLHHLLLRAASAGAAPARLPALRAAGRAAPPYQGSLLPINDLRWPLHAFLPADSHHTVRVQAAPRWLRLITGADKRHWHTLTGPRCGQGQEAEEERQGPAQVHHVLLLLNHPAR